MFGYTTVLKRGRTMWDKELLPENLFPERLSQLREEMKNRNVDVLLVYGDVRQHGSLTWLTNYLPRVRDALFIFERGDTSSGKLLINVSLRDIPFSRSIGYTDDVMSYDELSERFIPYLRSLSEKNLRFGFVDVEFMPMELWKRLFEDDKPVLFMEMSEVLLQLRLLKNSDENRILADNTKIAEEAMQNLQEVKWNTTPHDEVSECAIAASVERFCRMQGAEDVMILIASGQESLLTRGQRMVGPESQVAMLLSVQVNRYWVQVGRTFTFSQGRLRELPGASHGQVKRIIQELRECSDLNRVLDTCRQWNERFGALEGRSLSTACSGIGLDLDEPLWGLSPQENMRGLSLGVRWESATTQGMDLWAQTIVV